MFSRQDWGAVGTVPRDPMGKFRIAVHHTVSRNRSWTKGQEMEHMRDLERQHINQGWQTIGYSFVLFPSGRVYVGRGWTGLPAAQAGENSGAWALAYAGNAETKAPSWRARRKYRSLIGEMKKRGGWQLGGHREFPNEATACPGAKMMPYVRKWRGDFGLRQP